MKFSAKAITAVTFIAAMGVSAAAATMEEQSAEQFKSFNSMSVTESAKIVTPTPSYNTLTRDIFREVDACSILNAQFIMQPTIKDALSMLKPCLDGVSKMNGNAQITASAVNNGKAIEIVVLGEKNEAAKELVRGALAKRNNQVFGYPATAVVHAAEPHAASRFVYADAFAGIQACIVVDAKFIMQPTMKDALGMLKPCLDEVSKSLNAPVFAEQAPNGGIEIVVLGSKNEAVIPVLNSTLIKRNNQLFGYPAAAVIHAAVPH